MEDGSGPPTVRPEPHGVTAHGDSMEWSFPIPTWGSHVLQVLAVASVYELCVTDAWKFEVLLRDGRISLCQAFQIGPDPDGPMTCDLAISDGRARIRFGGPGVVRWRLRTQLVRTS
jgi:hypothetical protein